MSRFEALHTCRCVRCTDLQEFETGERTGPNHIAIRFGTGWIDGDPDRWIVLYDGEYVPNVVEAKPGYDDGEVVFHPPTANSQHGHVCFQCSLEVSNLGHLVANPPRKVPNQAAPGACTLRWVGDVEVYRVPKAETYDRDWLVAAEKTLAYLRRTGSIRAPMVVLKERLAYAVEALRAIQDEDTESALQLQLMAQEALERIHWK